MDPRGCQAHHWVSSTPLNMRSRFKAKTAWALFLPTSPALSQNIISYNLNASICPCPLPPRPLQFPLKWTLWLSADLNLKTYSNTTEWLANPLQSEIHVTLNQGVAYPSCPYSFPFLSLSLCSSSFTVFTGCLGCSGLKLRSLWDEFWHTVQTSLVERTCFIWHVIWKISRRENNKRKMSMCNFLCGLSKIRSTWGGMIKYYTVIQNQIY